MTDDPKEEVSPNPNTFSELAKKHSLQRNIFMIVALLFGAGSISYFSGLDFALEDRNRATFETILENYKRDLETARDNWREELNEAAVREDIDTELEIITGMRLTEDPTDSSVYPYCIELEDVSKKEFERAHSVAMAAILTGADPRIVSFDFDTAIKLGFFVPNSKVGNMDTQLGSFNNCPPDTVTSSDIEIGSKYMAREMMRAIAFQRYAEAVNTSSAANTLLEEFEALDKEVADALKAAAPTGENYQLEYQYSFFNNLVVRVGSVALALYLIALFMGFARYHSRVANYYQGRAAVLDAALQHEPGAVAEILKASGPENIPFGKEPPIPIDQLINLARTAKGKD